MAWPPSPVIPAEAGIHEHRTVFFDPGFRLAFAGVTAERFFIQRGRPDRPVPNSQRRRSGRDDLQ
jgi:hypothetical protein